MYIGLRLVEHKIGIIKGVAQEEFNLLLTSFLEYTFLFNSEITLSLIFFKIFQSSSRSQKPIIWSEENSSYVVSRSN